MAVVNIQVGALFPEPYQQPFAQPGGVGTPVVPQQAVGEMTGIFRSPCGHSINAWETAWAAISTILVTSFKINDVFGNIWTFAITDAGILSATKTGVGIIPPSVFNVLNLPGYTTNSFQLIVDASGLLNSSPVPYSSSAVSAILLQGMVDFFEIGIFQSGPNFLVGAQQVSQPSSAVPQRAIVKCPACGFIVNIYDPATWASFPILVG